MPEAQIVDPSVSKRKFEREISQYRSLELTYRRRGWLLIDAIFPEVLIVFSAIKLKPASIACATLLDFTNYDLQPPSVTFVDPFTREPLKFKDLQLQMLRRIKVADQAAEAANGPMTQIQILNMIQGHKPDDVPFLCLPGVREYHNHPGHTGDPWLLHRPSGEGSLPFVLDQIWKYGVRPIAQLQLQLEIKTAGFLIPPQAISE